MNDEYRSKMIHECINEERFFSTTPQYNIADSLFTHAWNLSNNRFLKQLVRNSLARTYFENATKFQSLSKYNPAIHAIKISIRFLENLAQESCDDNKNSIILLGFAYNTYAQILFSTNKYTDANKLSIQVT